MRKWLVSSAAVISLFSSISMASAADTVAGSVYNPTSNIVGNGVHSSGPSMSTMEAKSYSSSGRGFANDWTAYDSGGTGFNTWEVEYGYNTLFINEDFIHGYHNQKAHTVKLTNNNGSGSYSDSSKGGSWSRVDVRHSGNFVYYNFNF